MSNDDLLAGLTPAAPKKSGRVAKAAAKAAAAPVVPASTKETLPEVIGGAADAGVNATDVEVPTDAAPAPQGEELIRSADGELVSEQNEDGSSSVILPPVSPDFALHMAQRVRTIGAKREYAYNRLIRQGKKL